MIEKTRVADKSPTIESGELAVTAVSGQNESNLMEIAALGTVENTNLPSDGDVLKLDVSNKSSTTLWKTTFVVIILKLFKYAIYVKLYFLSVQ